MTDDSLIHHKSYTIRLMSYRSDGQWVPLATVYSSPESEKNGHPVTADRDDRLPTREAANAVAKKMAIEWIDLRFPSAAD